MSGSSQLEVSETAADEWVLDALKPLWQRHNLTVTLEMLRGVLNSRLAESDCLPQVDVDDFFASGLSQLLKMRKVTIDGVSEITSDFQTYWEMLIIPGTSLHFVSSDLSQMFQEKK